MSESPIPADYSFAQHRESTLSWLESLYAGGGRYRLWSGGEPHLLPTAFAVFLLELFDALPKPGSERCRDLCTALLAQRDPASGLFRLDQQDRAEGRNHDLRYIEWQQTQFALQALRILGDPADCALPFLDPWRGKEGISSWLHSQNWRDPWLASNPVMFLFYFFRHEAEVLQREQSWQDADELRRQLGELQRSSGLWGEEAERRVYNAVYGAFHYLHFWLVDDLPMPRSVELLRWTRRLQTNEGYFAHHRGGGACEDYDCTDLLIKLGTDEDRRFLDRYLERSLADRNPDGGWCWARKRGSGAGFLLRNFNPGLSLFENRKLFSHRLLDLAGAHRVWYYSGLRNLECPTQASDSWSTWFRNLVLAEYCERFGPRGLGWRFRSFASLGWHQPGNENT